MSFFSYNYLKGINLFDSNRNFKIKYSKVDGLSTSDPVTLNGFKIGRVHKINFNPNNTKELIVDIIIENDVNFSNTSIAELYETGLIGGKAIAIIPDYKNDSIIAKDGDYINGIIKPGLTELVNQILPQVQLQVEAVMKNAEIAFENINNFVWQIISCSKNIYFYSILFNQLIENSRKIIINNIVNYIY